MNSTRIIPSFNVEAVDFRNRVTVPVEGIDLRINWHVTLCLPTGAVKEAVVCSIHDGIAELCVFS